MLLRRGPVPGSRHHQEPLRRTIALRGGAALHAYPQSDVSGNYACAARVRDLLQLGRDDAGADRIFRGAGPAGDSERGSSDGAAVRVAIPRLQGPGEALAVNRLRIVDAADG